MLISMSSQSNVIWFLEALSFPSPLSVLPLSYIVFSLEAGKGRDLAGSCFCSVCARVPWSLLFSPGRTALIKAVVAQSLLVEHEKSLSFDGECCGQDSDSSYMALCLWRGWASQGAWLCWRFPLLTQPDASPKESTPCAFGTVQLPLHVPFWALG